MQTHFKRYCLAALAAAALSAAGAWPLVAEAQTSQPATARAQPVEAGKPGPGGDCDGDGTADTVRKPAPTTACPGGRCTDSAKAQTSPGPKVSCMANPIKGAAGSAPKPASAKHKIEHSGDPHEYLNGKHMKDWNK